jgi:catechol 2,3-dioxygenase-like lactoylglutathione lyase family enzyme
MAQANGRLHAVDHVQIAIPRGEEETARTFYAGVLGLEEVQKPARLAGRGGCWFASGGISLHLGVEDEFRPARAEVIDDDALETHARAFVFDPFGNRIELMEPRKA